MLRTQIVKFARPATRSFSVAAVRPTGVDQNSLKSGSSSGDAFNKREQASENMFIREREKEALRALKEKLKAQRKHLDELDAHIADLEKDKGGEQH